MELSSTRNLANPRKKKQLYKLNSHLYVIGRNRFVKQKKKTKRDDFYLQLQNLTRKHIDIEDKVKQKLNDTLP